MNKKTLIEKATLLLEDYKEMEEEKRHYDGYNFHCMNVKRYDDYINIEDLTKKRFKKYTNDLTDFFDDDYINNIYDDWLHFIWGDLNYQVSDIEEITKGTKNFCKSFKYIESQNDEDDIILACGRSDSWACFQDNLNYEVEDVLVSIIEWNVEEMQYLDVICSYYKYSYNENKDEVKILKDIDNRLKEIEGMMVEVKTLKKYIYNFNRSLNFKDEIIYRIKEQVEEIEAKRKEQAENLNTLKVDLMALANKMDIRLELHKKHKEFKENISRHLTGIAKVLKN